MNVYRDGSAVNATFSLIADSGDVIAVTTASYRVYDHNGLVRVPPTNLVVAPGAEAATVTIPSVENYIDDGKRAVIAVELTIVDENGSISTLLERYVLESVSWVEIGENSYQSYEQALMLALGLTNMNAWDASVERERMAALAEAHIRLGKLAYNVSSGIEDPQSRLMDYTDATLIKDINALDKESLLALPERFLTALRHAQLAEANHILGGDPDGELRRAGVMAKTTGESKQMFRHGKPVVMAVCDRAMRYLSGYVVRGVGVARVS